MLYTMLWRTLPSFSLAILSVLFMAGCGRLTGIALPQDSPPVRSPSGNTQPTKINIVQRAKGLIGIPYRYGGASPRRGLDCSGFVYYVHSKQGIKIPRTTRKQYLFSRPIDKTALRPGDLVFFRLKGNKISHVGLYIGAGKFIHAPSTGKAVQQSHLNNPFWRQRWVRGGRFF